MTTSCTTTTPKSRNQCCARPSSSPRATSTPRNTSRPSRSTTSTTRPSTTKSRPCSTDSHPILPTPYFYIKAPINLLARLRKQHTSSLFAPQHMSVPTSMIIIDYVNSLHTTSYHFPSSRSRSNMLSPNKIIAMIIHNKPQEPFCERVKFSHETGVIENTAEVRRFMQTFKSGFRTRKCMSAPKLAHQQNNYNHYFVNPQLRYKQRTVNPKAQKKNLVNQDFLYNNLHDPKFNSWRHPFERDSSQQEEPKYQLTEEQTTKLLQFKQYVQQVKKGRVPALVNEFIKQPH